MPQLTIRLPEELALDVKAEAAAAGRSVNQWVVTVLRAATDPEMAGTDVERTRARLARAGILHFPSPRKGRPPDPALVRKAAKAAARGKSLSDYVIEGRGPR